MATILHMRPQDPPISWEEFRAHTAPFAIALDGYVCAGPRFDATGPRLNLNHHEEVDRLATRATCAQVLMVIRQGLGLCFGDERGLRGDVYVNDCDEDICVAWFLLQHAPLAEQTINPALNRLVSMVDALDTTAGAYPFPADWPLLRELAWTFEPYRRFRSSGELDRRDPPAFRAVVAEVEQRIGAHLTGRGQAVPLDTRYRRIGGGPQWTMIEEVGAQARTGAFADGIRAYVAARQRPDGNWTYTVGRMSLFIPFDVPRIFAVLNATEETTTDRWSGGNTIGGSPRVQGSRLPPTEVERIINRVVSCRMGGGVIS